MAEDEILHVRRLGFIAPRSLWRLRISRRFAAPATSAPPTGTATVLLGTVLLGTVLLGACRADSVPPEGANETGRR